MSFFSDFVESVSVDDIGNKICCEIIFGCAIKISANFKVDNLGASEIVLRCKKTRIRIFGKDLKIATLSKGEMEITGGVEGVVEI